MAPKVPIEELLRFKVDKAGINEVLQNVQKIGTAQRANMDSFKKGQQDVVGLTDELLREVTELNKAIRSGSYEFKDIAKGAQDASAQAAIITNEMMKGARAGQRLAGNMTSGWKQQGSAVVKSITGDISKGVGGVRNEIKSAVSPLMRFGWIGMILMLLEKVISYAMVLRGQTGLIAANAGIYTQELGSVTNTMLDLKTKFLMTTRESGQFLTTLVQSGAEMQEIVHYADDIKAREVLWNVAASKQVETMQYFQDTLKVSTQMSNNLLWNIMKTGASLSEWTASEFLDQVISIVKFTRDLNMSVEGTVAFFHAMSDVNILERTGLGELGKISKEGRIEIAQAATTMSQLSPGMQAYLGMQSGMGKTPIEAVVRMRRGELSGGAALGAIFQGAHKFVGGEKDEFTREYKLQQYLGMVMPNVSEQTRIALAQAWAPEMADLESFQGTKFDAIIEESKKIKEQYKSSGDKLVDHASHISKDLQGLMGWLKSFLNSMLQKAEPLFKKLVDVLNKLEGVLKDFPKSPGEWIDKGIDKTLGYDTKSKDYLMEGYYLDSGKRTLVGVPRQHVFGVFNVPGRGVADLGGGVKGNPSFILSQKETPYFGGGAELATQKGIDDILADNGYKITAVGDLADKLIKNPQAWVGAVGAIEATVGGLGGSLNKLGFGKAGRQDWQVQTIGKTDSGHTFVIYTNTVVDGYAIKAVIDGETRKTRYEKMEYTGRK